MSIFGKTDAERKACPVFDGAIMYFPRALAAIARHSQLTNQKHNPGEPLRWAREKSTDHMNTASRHMIDHAKGIIWDGKYHNLTAAGWRVLAALETHLELVEGIDAVTVAQLDAARKERIAGQPLKRLDGYGQTHCVPEGSNWLPSDNCQCDTCRLWIYPPGMGRDTLRSRNKYPNAAAVNTAIDQVAEPVSARPLTTAEGYDRYVKGTAFDPQPACGATAQTATSMAGAICAAPESAWRRQCFDIRCVLDVNHWGLCRAGNGDGIYGDGISADTAKG